MKELVTVYYP